MHETCARHVRGEGNLIIRVFRGVENFISFHLITYKNGLMIGHLNVFLAQEKQNYRGCSVFPGHLLLTCQTNNILILALCSTKTKAAECIKSIASCINQMFLGICSVLKSI